MYLFKNAFNQWVFGMTVNSFFPAGTTFVEVDPDETKISIRSVNRDFTFVSQKPFGEFKKENGAVYASFAELKAAYAGFFNSEFTGLTDGTQKTQVVKSNGDPADFAGTPGFIEGQVTRPADQVTYLANDNIGTLTAAVKQKETVTLTGTGGSVNISIPNKANRTVAFITDLAATAAKFVTDYAADFLPEIVVTSVGDDVIFEAATAGVPFDAPVVTNTDGDLDGTVAHTTANGTLVAIEVHNAAIRPGGGGLALGLTVQSDITQMAGVTIRLFPFNAQPAGVVGDNVPYVHSASNWGKRTMGTYIDVVMDAVLNGGSIIIGKATISEQYHCAEGDTKLYFLVATLGGITTPKSGGYIKIGAEVLKLR